MGGYLGKRDVTLGMINFLTRSKIKWYAFLIVAAFTFGLVETLFSDDDERTEREYTFVQQAIRTNDSLNIKYGKPHGFSSHPSYNQRIDTSTYNFVVEYEHKGVHMQCTIINDGNNRSRIYSLSEFKGNSDVIKDKLF